jgi:hypothetical protein
MRRDAYLRVEQAEVDEHACDKLELVDAVAVLIERRSRRHKMG